MVLIAPAGSPPELREALQRVRGELTVHGFSIRVVASDDVPSIRELASASQISVITVKRAYLELERAGVIVTRQGKGSFVADTLDATRTLAAQEFQSQLDGLLVAAGKLGLSRQEVIERVVQALDGSDT